jgi:hypothetical protein
VLRSVSFRQVVNGLAVFGVLRGYFPADTECKGSREDGFGGPGGYPRGILAFSAGQKAELVDLPMFSYARPKSFRAEKRA